MTEFHQAPHTFVGQVDLKVSNIERSLSFYQNIIGFQVLEKAENKILLTADGKTPLLSIEQPEMVLPKEPRTTGLYHFALLLPTRADLGQFLHHLIQSGYPLQGASDHLVSEALYFADPDGNGIEVYADRPSSTWKWGDSQVDMATEPIDAEDLLAHRHGKKWDRLPEGTVMGHIHLHVSELQKTQEFYCQGLGFDIVSKYGNHALFISTGRYHHHIGLNTWAGIGAPKPSTESVGLKWFSLVLPNEKERTKVIEQLRQIGATVEEKDGAYFTEDPSGNRIALRI